MHAASLSALSSSCCCAENIHHGEYLHEPHQTVDNKHAGREVWASPFVTAENPELKEKEPTAVDRAILIVAKLIIFAFSTVVTGLGILTIIMAMATSGNLSRLLGFNSFFSRMIPVGMTRLAIS